MVPDYSPAMLRLFLAGRAARLAADEGLSAKTARLRLSWRLRREAGIARDALAAAFAGTLRAALPRARLWAALGHFPSDHGVMLADDGGQAASISPASAGGNTGGRHEVGTRDDERAISPLVGEMAGRPEGGLHHSRRYPPLSAGADISPTRGERKAVHHG